MEIAIELNQLNNKTSVHKKFNAKKYSGKVKFKGDPLAIQKKLRDEWK